MKVKSITDCIPKRRYYGIDEVIKDRKWFDVGVRIQIQILMCLIRDVNHEYVRESLIEEASEDELEVMVRQYKGMLDMEKVWAMNSNEK